MGGRTKNARLSRLDGHATAERNKLSLEKQKREKVVLVGTLDAILGMLRRSCLMLIQNPSKASEVF